MRTIFLLTFVGAWVDLRKNNGAAARNDDDVITVSLADHTPLDGLPWAARDYLYFIHEADDLLYIGRTGNPSRRIGEHANTKIASAAYLRQISVSVISPEQAIFAQAWLERGTEKIRMNIDPDFSEPALIACFSPPNNSAVSRWSWRGVERLRFSVDLLRVVAEMSAIVCEAVVSNGSDLKSVSLDHIIATLKPHAMPQAEVQQSPAQHVFRAVPKEVA